MNTEALNNQMTAKKPPQLTFFDCFEWVMRNQKDCRKAFAKIVGPLFKCNVGIESYVFSDIGFSLVDKEQDFTLTIENVGSDLKVLITRAGETSAKFFKSEKEFSLMGLVHGLKNL